VVVLGEETRHLTNDFQYAIRRYFNRMRYSVPDLLQYGGVAQGSEATVPNFNPEPNQLGGRSKNLAAQPIFQQ
jgi:hypothetical protein